MPAISFGAEGEEYAYPSFAPQINLHFIKLNDEEIEYGEDGIIYSKYNDLKASLIYDSIDNLCLKLKPFIAAAFNAGIKAGRILTYDVFTFIYNNKFGAFINETDLSDQVLIGIKEGYKFITGEVE